MATRIIKKNLAGEEDILFGEGTVIQTRNDASYNINKVRTVRPVNSLVELNALDPEQFPKAVLFDAGVTTTYAYNVGTGLWEVQDAAKHVLSYSTLADATADTTMKVGDAISLAERTAGNGGGGMWDAVLASTVTVNGDTIVQSTGVPTLALVERKWGQLLAEPTKKYKIVAGVIRNTGAGWKFLDDAGHAPVGFAGTVTDNGYTLELDYSFSGAKVGSVVACPDETFAKFGLTFGASVGVNETVLSFGVRDNFYAIGTTVAGQMLGHAAPTIVDNGTYLEVSNGPSGGSVSTRGAAPVLTPFIGGGRYTLEADHRNGETTRIRAYSPLAAKVYYDGAAWQIDSEHDISHSFASGELILTVGTGGFKGVPVVGKFGPATAYDPVITAYNGTTINVKFADSGAFVTPVDTNMSFTLGAGNTQITDHSGVGFCYERGYGAGKWSELVSAAGNIWVYGIIETD